MVLFPVLKYILHPLFEGNMVSINLIWNKPKQKSTKINVVKCPLSRFESFSSTVFIVSFYVKYKQKTPLFGTADSA
jgi:hypothetical protein